MTISATLGFPRIGAKRELKKALDSAAASTEQKEPDQKEEGSDR